MFAKSSHKSVRRPPFLGATALMLLLPLGLLLAPGSAQATPILASADNFAVLGATTVTNTGTTAIIGDLGVYPGTAITGMGPPSTVIGTTYAGGPVAAQAQTDALTAFNALGAMPMTANLSGMNLGGMTLTPGVYYFSSSAQLTGTLTLNFASDPTGSFVFQIGSTLTTASLADVIVENGGPESSIFWDVGSAATLGTGTDFDGNILADTSITLNTGTDICGRAIALTGAVTLDTNAVTNDCPATDFGSLGFSGAGTPASPPPSSVPEPTSALLLATALLGAAASMRGFRLSSGSASRLPTA
jgi:Ice-binding-like